MKKRNLLKSLVAMTMIIGSMTLSFSVDYPTYEEIEKENKVLEEMIGKYTYEQMADQIEEEVYGREGWFKTGGKDGKMLDGTPAPNAPGNTKPACDHSYYKESTKEATCTEKGKITYKCDKCGDTYTESIAKLDHTFTVTDEVAGTCVEVGYRTETCSVCGLEQIIDGVYGDHVLAVNGEQKEPTCEETGIKTEQCTVCFEVFTTELPATGHAFETKPTVDEEAFCGSTGKQSYHCANCDATTGEEVIPELGHDPITEEKKAGLFSDGYTKVTCNRCGVKLSEEIHYAFTTVYRPYIIAAALWIFVIVYVAILLIKKKKKK